MFSFGAESDDEETGAVDVDKELDMLEQELNGDGVGDKEPEVDDTNEIAADVMASNSVVLEDIVTAAELDARLIPLTTCDANLGRLSIAKVFIFYLES